MLSLLALHTHTFSSRTNGLLVRILVSAANISCGRLSMYIFLGAVVVCSISSVEYYGL